jgi:hypothetical protein
LTTAVVKRDRRRRPITFDIGRARLWDSLPAVDSEAVEEEEEQMSRTIVAAFLLAIVSLPGAARAVDPTATPGVRETIRVGRAPAPITIDGDLSDAGWAGVRPIGTWYQISPASEAAPKVATTVRMVYDDRALYLAFELEDPDPGSIRAPLTDRDNALASSDYAGIIIDGVDDGKTAQEFLANPRGVQYDAIWSDIAGEDLAPNFYWTAAAATSDRGWRLEMRIPFSSIRYVPGPNPVWGITLFRNWPRERRYQFATAVQPTSCFICNENRLEGLTGLPAGGSWVLAPYAAGRRSSTPAGGLLGAPLENGDVAGDYGFDLKWNPSARHTVDATVHPDFSQIETDVAQISTNQRFALFFPERRPFFLEGIDLFSTPLDAIYTRTVTDPRSGLRATGRFGDSSYTLLLADDRGGGSVVIPGPTSSTTALQDFESTAVVGRLRRDVGNSYLSFIVSDREVDGGGSNRVAGPDFQWHPREADTVTGQYLWSQSETPVRPDLAPEWDGRKLSDGAALLSWEHGAGAWDWTLSGRDVGAEFRADNGYVPRVGYREGFGELGHGWGISGTPFRGLRLFVSSRYDEGEESALLSRVTTAGINLASRGTLHLTLGGRSDDERVEGLVLSQNQGYLKLSMEPSETLADFVFSAHAGSAIDYDNARTGTGAGATLGAVLRSREHLEVRVDLQRETLDVDRQGAPGGRLFTADLARVRTTWTFTRRFFVRVISQLVETRRDPTLYTFAVDAKSSDLESSLLLAYKLNWQSVAYLGYGDSRLFSPTTARREAAGKELFFKISYALQR